MQCSAVIQDSMLHPSEALPSMNARQQNVYGSSDLDTEDPRDPDWAHTVSSTCTLRMIKEAQCFSVEDCAHQMQWSCERKLGQIHGMQLNRCICHNTRTLGFGPNCEGYGKDGAGHHRIVGCMQTCKASSEVPHAPRASRTSEQLTRH